jgi:hypothetical protein
MASFERHVSPSPSAARAALERLIESAPFSGAPQLTAFLRFVVEAALDGRAETIKAYTVAVEALGRPESFDPASNAIVRVEAGRLRAALARFYDGDGVDDPVVIDLPRGSYVPEFRWRDAADGVTAAAKETNGHAALPQQHDKWRTREALHAAALLIEERAVKSERLAQQARQQNRTALAASLDARTEEWLRRAQAIRRLIEDSAGVSGHAEIAELRNDLRRA